MLRVCPGKCTITTVLPRKIPPPRLGGRNKLLCSASPAGSFVSEKVLTYSKNIVPKQCFFDQICQKTSKKFAFRPGTNLWGGNNISGRAVCIPNVRCRTQQFILPPLKGGLKSFPTVGAKIQKLWPIGISHCILIVEYFRNVF